MPADGTLTARAPERKYRHIPFLGQVKRSYIICSEIRRGAERHLEATALVGLLDGRSWGGTLMLWQKECPAAAGLSG
jgi:hypothetical protein